MSVTPSPIGGFAGQFFDNNGQPLSGGKIYTYAAGTTTPQATYTSALGITPHSNPIILDSAGRVPGGEIWLTDGLVYKFVIETSTGGLIGTYDNITGVNSNFVNYTVQEEVITATAGQTVFNLSTINYTPNTNSLSVYIDGVNQYVGDSYLETDSDTVTFTAGVHVGGEVKFTTAVPVTTGAIDASTVGYTANFTSAVGQTVQTKLEQYISVKDFGAVGDGVADDTAAIQAAIDYVDSLNGSIEIPFAPGETYLVTGLIPKSGVYLNLQGSTIKLAASSDVPVFFDGGTGTGGSNFGVSNGILDCNQANNADINVVGGVWLSNWTNLIFDDLTIINCSRSGLNLIGVQHVKIRNYQFLNCGKVGAFFAYGITLEKFGTVRSRYVDIDGFTADNVIGFGIHFFECDDFVAKNLSFNDLIFGSSSIAITCTEALRGEIGNVQCTSVAGDSIEINDSTDITLTNCNVVNTGNRALVVGVNTPGNVNTRIKVTNFSCTGTGGSVSAVMSSNINCIYTNINFDKGIDTTVSGVETGNVMRDSTIATAVATAPVLLRNQFTLENVKFSDFQYKYFGSRTANVVLPLTTLAAAAAYNINMPSVFGSKFTLSGSVAGDLSTITAFAGAPTTQGSYQTCNFLVNDAGTAANLSTVTLVNSAVARALTITGDAANKRIVLTNGTGNDLNVCAEINAIFHN